MRVRVKAGRVRPFRNKAQATFATLTALDVDIAERAATTTMGRVGNGLKNALRRQVRRAGLGEGLARAWRSKRFPDRRTVFSLNAAAMVWSKARRIHDAFTDGGTVSAQGGEWLVIPTDAAEALGLDENKQRTAEGAGGVRGDANVALAEARFGRLSFVQARADKAFLIAQVDGTPTVLFTLVKRVRIPKLLDPPKLFDRWQRRIPLILAREFEKQDRRAGRG